MALLRRHRPELALVAAFAVTRLVAHLVFRLDFDSATLGYWQMLDVPLLRGDLLRSLYYLHAQPPLYNLAVGVVLKWVPEALAPVVFEAIFLVLGYLAIVGIHALLVELGAPRGAALAAALVQVLSTTWLVYESWLFYTLPTAVLMTWAAVWLARAARGLAGAAAAFAAAVATLSWIRATYQPAWVMAALALLLLAVRECTPAVRAVAWRASLAALALTLFLPAKNYLLVGSFTSSTWFGMNLAPWTLPHCWLRLRDTALLTIPPQPLRRPSPNAAAAGNSLEKE